YAWSFNCVRGRNTISPSLLSF
ncbi:hypothetical protein A2U01_0104328, partial [Trifolium medium]|nr:hypothetical protein [Trifolium medium]